VECEKLVRGLVGLVFKSAGIPKLKIILMNLGFVNEALIHGLMRYQVLV